MARQAELLGQVEEAESTLAAEERHAVLESMLYTRRSALDHATEEPRTSRLAQELGRQREKLSRMGAELGTRAGGAQPRAWPRGPGQLHEIRSGLRSRRRELLVAEEMARAQEAEADEAQRQRRGARRRRASSRAK